MYGDCAVPQRGTGHAQQRASVDKTHANPPAIYIQHRIGRQAKPVLTPTVLDVRPSSYCEIPCRTYCISLSKSRHVKESVRVHCYGRPGEGCRAQAQRGGMGSHRLDSQHRERERQRRVRVRVQWTSVQKNGRPSTFDLLTSPAPQRNAQLVWDDSTAVLPLLTCFDSFGSEGNPHGPGRSGQPGKLRKVPRRGPWRIRQCGLCVIYGTSSHTVTYPVHLSSRGSRDMSI